MHVLIVLLSLLLHSSLTLEEQPLYSTPVHDASDNLIGTLNIFSDEEPVDAIAQFMHAHTLPVEYLNFLLSSACSEITCTRVEPALFSQDVDIGYDEPVELLILEGEEPIDSVYSFCLTYDLGSEGRDMLWEIVSSSPGLSQYITRDVALIWSREIEGHGTIAIYENEEPVDVIAEHFYSQGIESYEDRKFYQDAVLRIACEEVYCRRTRAMVWSERVESEDGVEVGEVEVLEGDEPVDAIHKFVVENGLTMEYRDLILQMCCEAIDCERDRPLAYEKTVNDEHGSSIGTLKILESQEVADTVIRFLIDTQMSADPASLKNYFFTDACDRPGVSCSRSHAVLYERGFDLGESARDEEVNEEHKTLTITEYDDPVDAIWTWINVHPTLANYTNVHKTQIFSRMKKVVCTDVTDDNKYARFLCSRGKPGPVLFGPQPITGPDQSHVGDLTIHLGEEPADAVYKFFSRYGLEEKGWDVAQVVKQICDIPQVTGFCTRSRPVKYHSDDVVVTVPDGDGDRTLHLGPMTIWIESEVIDEVHAFSLHHNLTVQTQMTIFHDICKSPDVHCKRTRAVVYERVVNRNDHDVVRGRMNGTCDRQFAGWRFIAGWDEVWWAKKIGLIEFMNKETTEDIIEDKNFIWKVYLVLLGFVRLLCGSIWARGRERETRRKMQEERREMELRESRKRRAVGLEIQLKALERMKSGYEEVVGCDRVCGGEGGEAVEEKESEEETPREESKEELLSLAEGEIDRLTASIQVLTSSHNPPPSSSCSSSSSPPSSSPFTLNLTTKSSIFGRSSPPSLLPSLPLLVLLLSPIPLLSFFSSHLIEPTPSIDSAMHAFKGSLPKLQVLEGEEAADAVWRWAKEGAKTHHPLFRQPVYYDLIDELCGISDNNRTNSTFQSGLGVGPGLGPKGVLCTRTRAWEVLECGSLTLWGMNHEMKYLRDPSDFLNEFIEDRIPQTAEEICERLTPPPPNCFEDISKHIMSQIEIAEEKRASEKDLYKRLSVTSDATISEIYSALRHRLNGYGVNMSPYARVDNGTVHRDQVHKWGVPYGATWAILDKVGELLDETKREWYDKPCEPVFGGAMCAKKDSQGNMMIEMG